MFIEQLGGVFSQSFYYLWDGFISFVPFFLAAVVIFIIGWIIASVIGKLVHQLIDAIKLNSLFESAGAGHAMEAHASGTVAGVI